MNRLIKWLNQIIKKQKGLKRWQRVMTVLAALITFATTYALILPAITVEKNSIEEVGGMYLEKTADQDDLLLENALEPRGASIDEENKEAVETDAEIPVLDGFQGEDKIQAVLKETNLIVLKMQMVGKK